MNENAALPQSNWFLKHVKPVYLIIILLSLISQRIVYNQILYLLMDSNIDRAKVILRGAEEPPYQYRVLKPVISTVFDKVLSVVDKSETSRYKLYNKFLLFAGFFLLYLFLYKFFRLFYSDLTSLFGLALLAIAIPLTMQNQVEEGDCIHLFFFILMLYLMFKNKDWWIPAIIGLAAFNREQSVYMLVFYAVYLWEQKKIFKKQSILVILSSIVIFTAVYLGIRFYFGFKDTNYTIWYHITSNTEFISSISRLWFEQILILFIISIAVYRKSRLFFKLSLWCLVPYTIVFFFFGIMGELGKYLPAILILIMMSLQIFKGEYTLDRKMDVQQSVKAG